MPCDEKRLESSRAYYARNAEVIRAKNRERARQHYARNPEVLRERTRRWRSVHPELAKEVERKSDRQRPGHSMDWRQAKPEKFQEQKRRYQPRKEEVGKTYRKERVLFLRAERSDCGRVFPWYVMEFDHREPVGSKGKRISHFTNRSMKVLKTELAKCDLVCANCHKIRTYKSGVQRHGEYADNYKDIQESFLGRASAFRRDLYRRSSAASS